MFVYPLKLWFHQDFNQSLPFYQFKCTKNLAFLINYKNLYFQGKKTLSDQDYQPPKQEDRYEDGNTVPSPVVVKIKDVLNFIRNEFLEVPFIAFYRKEYIYTDVNKINKSTDLELPDLWKIYEMDEKYCQLKNRKENFIKLVERMRHYQGELLKELKTKRYVRVRQIWAQ